MSNKLTPYGVTPQPQFSYEPGSIEWGVLLMVAAVILFLFWLATYLRKRRYKRIERALLRELDTLKALWKTDPKLAATCLSSIAKRILNLRHPTIDYLALSAAEIKNHILKIDADREATITQDTIDVCVLLETLETFSFSPPANTDLQEVHMKMGEILEKMCKLG